MRALIAAVACASLAMLWPTAGRTSPPAISVSGRADAGVFTVTLRGAASLAGSPHSGGGVIIMALAGDLAAPTGRVVFTHPLPGVNDIVVAQHDDTVIWMVAHLAVSSVPFSVAAGGNEIRVTFGRRGADAAPVAHPQPPAPPQPVAHPQPSAPPPAAHPQPPPAPSHPPVTPPGPAKPAAGSLSVSVNWGHTPLNEALADLESATNTVIIADIGVDGFLTLRMDNVRLADVLQAIANQLHVQVVKRGETYWLTRNP